jgi:hypothetical protein
MSNSDPTQKPGVIISNIAASPAYGVDRNEIFISQIAMDLSHFT